MKKFNTLLVLLFLTANFSLFSEEIDKKILANLKTNITEYGNSREKSIGFQVIYKNEQVAGAAVSVQLRKNKAELELINVEKKWQNRGIGNYLFDKIIEKLKDSNIKRLDLIASPIGISDKNEQLKVIPRLIKFYENIGAVIVDNTNPLEIKMKYDIK